jgi:hypothetical protein
MTHITAQLVLIRAFAYDSIRLFEERVACNQGQTLQSLLAKNTACVISQFTLLPVSRLNKTFVQPNIRDFLCSTIVEQAANQEQATQVLENNM